MIQSSLWEVCEERSMTVCRLRKQTTPLRLLLHRASVLSLRAFQLHACSAVLNFFFAAATFVPRNKFWNSFQQHLGVGSFLYRSFHSLVVHSYIFSYCPLLFLSGDDDGDGSRKVLWMKINLWPAPTFAKRGASLNIFVPFRNFSFFFCFFGQFTSLCAQLLPISRTIFFGDF